MIMKYLSFFLILLFLGLSACNSTNSGEQNTAYSYFVTRLGTDTLAIERFRQEGNEVMAQVILRSPETEIISYQLTLDDQGGIAELLAMEPKDASFNLSDARVTQTVRLEDDSLVNEVVNNNGDIRSFSMLNEPGTLPFIDMVHWPFELAFQHAVKAVEDSITQQLLTGRRTSGFVIHKLSADSLTFRHPSRGVMGVTINSTGSLMKLDAALTTRKLIVTRTNELDFKALASAFVERDKNGSPFGALSGAVSEDFSFMGADFTVQYGSPQKRGREIFGGIVPWGQRWRTGANRATHFKTSKDLKIGTLEVPTGEYTLFTIPAPDGGTLIINKQTGQNGQSYDVKRDLGRVPMSLSLQDTVTEGFTVTVEESNTGGTLNLIWDKSVFSVDFTL